MTEEISEVPPGAEMVHEPHGFVRLVGHYGTDLGVVNCARVSFRKESDWKQPVFDPEHQYYRRELEESDEGLINFLMKNKHGTPFEQNYFQFHIRAPIFVFREWHRHRIGISINEESGRYVQLKPDFYLPDDDHVRVQEGKPGHYTYVPKGHEVMGSNGPVYSTQTYGDHTRSALERGYLAVYGTYEHLLELGIAKEIARACLPVAIYSQMYWTCNARSLMNFLALRNSPRALREIKDYAQVMEVIFAAEMPTTHAAFVANGRVAP